ncbi:hypothetical protein PENFLA_c052G09460 [Penicillium flavigenum]|uniref:Uncharacterized protein n=1 Tax=Penicillium flavigenum TaxID=254877 RepID=A0A1V6SHH7_9EURO|nr:hypothetical protein PENFLA_c052G09460 [Penicillium flavigenum]
MDLPASDSACASEDCLPSEVEKHASEQLERELQPIETYKDAPNLEHQMSGTLTIYLSYVQNWDPSAAFRELYQNCENLAVRIVKDMGNDLKLACLDPVILVVNMHTMLVYGVLYIWFEFDPFVFDGIYHFTAIQQGLAFFGILVGAAVSVVAYVLWLCFSYQPRVANANVVVEPEAPLVPGQIGAICIPICLFLFAWTSRASVHWIVAIIGTAFFTPDFYLTFQSVLNYLGESYPRYVASVFAGNTFFRSSFGGGLPLAAPRMLKFTWNWRGLERAGVHRRCHGALTFYIATSEFAATSALRWVKS